MPSVSKKQHNLMMAVAHSPAFAKKVGIPTSVGKEFAAADKGKKFRSGGVSARQGINQPTTHHGKAALFKQGGDMKKMAEGGSVKPSKMEKVKTAAPSRDGVVTKGHTRGKQVKMAGSTKGMKKGGKC